MLRVRLATPADVHAIHAIYATYVLSSTCTFQLTPESLEERAAWLAAHGERHPVTVAEDADGVVGWACLSPYKEREAYARTVEDSVYVRDDARGRGVGRALLADLVARAQALGHHTIIASITEGQAASVALHGRFGFVEVGRFAELGFKHGRWLGVVYLQRMLPAAPSSSEGTTMNE